MPARRALFALLVLLLLLIAPPGFAPAAHAQPTVEFTSTTMTVNFPDRLTFTMTAIGDDIVTAEVYWRPSGSTATSMAAATISPGDPVTAEHTVDTRTNYIPPGLHLEHFWRVITSDGAVHQSAIQTSHYLDTRFDWSAMETGLVNVYWYQGSEGFANDIARSANRTLTRLYEDFGLTTTTPMNIMVYASDNDFSGAMRPNSADWIGGVAYSGLSLIIVQIDPVSGANREIGRMIPHEVAHVVIHHAAANPYNSPPPWLDEGLSTWIQETPDTRLPPILDRAVREGRLIPVPALRSGFPLDPDQAMLSYAQSVSVVEFVVETWGEESAGRLVSIYQDEVTHNQALEEVLGMSIEELDIAWKAWLDYPGDKVEDPLASAKPDTSIIWLVLACGGATLFTLGMVGFFFWHTRSYREVEEEYVPESGSLDTPEPPLQP